MGDKQYDYKALINTFIKAKCSPNIYVHEDLSNYYIASLSKLEEAFGIHLSHENINFDQKVLSPSPHSKLNTLSSS